MPVTLLTGITSELTSASTQVEPDLRWTTNCAVCGGSSARFGRAVAVKLITSFWLIWHGFDEVQPLGRRNTSARTTTRTSGLVAAPRSAAPAKVTR